MMIYLFFFAVGRFIIRGSPEAVKRAEAMIMEKIEGPKGPPAENLKRSCFVCGKYGHKAANCQKK